MGQEQSEKLDWVEFFAGRANATWMMRCHGLKGARLDMLYGKSSNRSKKAMNLLTDSGFALLTCTWHIYFVWLSCTGPKVLCDASSRVTKGCHRGAASYQARRFYSSLRPQVFIMDTGEHGDQWKVHLCQHRKPPIPVSTGRKSVGIEDTLPN